MLQIYQICLVNLKKIKGLNKFQFKSDIDINNLIYNCKNIDYLDLSNIKSNNNLLYIYNIN